MFSIKGLSDVDLEILRKHLVRREVSKRSVIFEDGKKATSLFFLESGAIKLVQKKAQTDSLDDVVMSVIKPGGFFGEEALLGEVPNYLSTAIAMESSILLELSRENLQALMSASMSTGTKVLLGISKNYREAIVVTESLATTIIFYSPKDGVGKTSLAINTAVALARSGKKVGFIDADFQFGDAHLHLGLLPNPNITRLIQMEEILEFDRIKHFLQCREGVTLLACPEFAQESELVTRSNLAEIIQEMARNFEYLIIDSQSHLNEQTLLLWDTADHLVLVSEPDLSSLMRFRRLFGVLTRLDYPKKKFTCVVNRAIPESATIVEEFRKSSPNKFFTIANDSQAARRAILHGNPWAAEKPDSKVAADLTAFIDGLFGKEGEQGLKHRPGEERRGGIFDRIRAFLSAD